MVPNTEAVTERCFIKKVGLQISEIHRKKPAIESLAQVFSSVF